MHHGIFKREIQQRPGKTQTHKTGQPAHEWALELNQREIMLKNNVILCPVTILSSLKYWCALYSILDIVYINVKMYLCIWWNKREFHFGIAQSDKK